MHHLPPAGLVRANQDAAVFIRPGLIEEYTVSTDGVRQDFVVAERPPGAGGALAVELEVTGARAEAATYGVKLTLAATGRELAYSRLRVTDAIGRELEARIEVLNAGRLRVAVQDAQAVYPVRIDPTFSDADWVSMNSGIPGAIDAVSTLAVDGSGNLYAGGDFTAIGTVLANRIAKWNGSTWSALGSGLDGGSFPLVYSLAVIGADLYAGGKFTSAGGISATGIAKWNGSAWSALGSGVQGYLSSGVVYALAVSGTDLYVGGGFITAGGVSAINVAKWNGSAWSALGWGINGAIHAMAVSGADLYAGGEFTTIGGGEARTGSQSGMAVRGPPLAQD